MQTCTNMVLLLNGVPFCDGLDLARLPQMRVLLAVSRVRCRAHFSAIVSSPVQGVCAIT